ncbi:MAG: PaaI family thioesterase [Beijerinckiaceae bacterium]
MMANGAARAVRPKMNAEEVAAFLDREFPELQGNGEPTFCVDAVGPMTARMRLVYHPRHLRPGGTISGPAMFSLADVALYAAVLAQIGPVALAVTTNLSINFLRKPEPRDLIGEARLLKLGKRLAVGEVLIFSEAGEDLVAHATGTYSIPSYEAA